MNVPWSKRAAGECCECRSLSAAEILYFKTPMQETAGAGGGPVVEQAPVVEHLNSKDTFRIYWRFSVRKICDIRIIETLFYAKPQDSYSLQS